MSEPEGFFVEGRLFKPVQLPATGDWQLFQIEKQEVVILVHPNGRQAWFHKADMAETSRLIPNFRYTENPLKDLRRLAKRGLRPFHVDPDFDPGLLLAK